MTSLRPGWMRGLVVAVFLAAIAGAGGYVYYDKSQRTHQEQQQREARRSAVNARLSDFVKTTGSSADWDIGAGTRADRSLDTLLMVDLERAWLSGRTILFIGTISDVSVVDDQTYLVFVEYRPDWQTFLFSKELRLEVECSREKVQPLLDALKGSERRMFGGHGVAVAARITRVRRGTESGELDKTVYTGVGSCVDLLYIENLPDVGRR